jgi:deoxyribonuclease-4
LVRIGAHVPARGGPIGAIASARAIGARAVQIWASNPRQWVHPSIRSADADEFRAAWRESGLGPLVIHAPYLVNVASPNTGFRLRSVDLARATVVFAEAIGADGVVVHAGAGGAGRDPVNALAAGADSLVRIADEAEHSAILIELTAGTAGSVASTFADARRLMDACGGHPRLGLCADTCHLFAAGYALETDAGVRWCFDEVDRHGLTRRLQLIHANDSTFARGMHRDRHANIGHGHIGEEGFRAVLAHPAVRRCAIVIETPGTERERAEDVAALQRLATLKARR